MNYRNILLTHAILCLFLLTACEFHSDEPNTTYQTISTPVQKLSAVPELMTFIDVREDISLKAINSNVSPELLRDVFIAGDEKQFRQLLGINDSEYAHWQRRLSEASVSFLEKFPDYEGSISPDCDYDYFFQNYDRFLSRYQRSGDGVGRIAEGGGYDSGVDCDYYEYMGALVACATTGPWLYWVCAYFAMCEFCEGGYINNMCP